MMGRVRCTGAPCGAKNEPAGHQCHIQLSADVGPETDAYLIARWQGQHDERARDELLRRHEGLISSLARRFVTGWRGCEFDDAYQAARMGFVHALDKYEAGHGAALRTYASQWIRHELSHLIRHRGPVSIGGHQLNEAYKVRAAARGLVTEDGRYPEASDLAAHLGWTEERVRLALDAFNPASAKSLNTQLGDDESGATGLDYVVDESITGRPADAVEDQLDRALARDAIAEATAALTERERAVFQHRMVEGMGLREVGAMLGISHARVGQLEKSVKDRLSAALRDDPRATSLLLGS